MLAAEQRQKFAADGYLVLRQVLEPTALEPVRQVIGRFVDTCIRRLHSAGEIAHLYEQTSLARVVATSIFSADLSTNPRYMIGSGK